MRDFDNIQLRHCISGVLQNSISEANLNALIRFTVASAKVVLRLRYWRHLAFFSELGYSLDDAAKICVEELFLPREAQICAKLKKGMLTAGSDPAVLPLTELSHVFHGIVNRTIEHAIPRLLAEYDPYFKKILRSVHDIHANTAYAFVRGAAESHYHRTGQDTLHLHRPAYPTEELLQALSGRARHSDTIESLIETLFDILDEQEQYRRVLTLNTIVLVLRDFFLSHWIEQQDVVDFTEVCSELDMKQIAARALERLERQTLHHYSERENLSAEDCEKYMRAAMQYLRDLTNHDIRKYYEYYSSFYPDISKEEYRDGKRAQFEYVLTTVRETFVERCRKYFNHA